MAEVFTGQKGNAPFKENIMNHKNKKHPYWEVAIIHGIEGSFEERIGVMMSALTMIYNMHLERHVPTFAKIESNKSIKVICPVLSRHNKLILQDLGFSIVKEKISRKQRDIHFTKFNQHKAPMEEKFKFTRKLALEYADSHIDGHLSMSPIIAESFAYIAKNCLTDVPRRFEKKSIDLIEKGVINDDGEINWDIYNEVYNSN